MTKIEELEQKLNECQKELEKLKESKKENSGKWKPQYGNEFWFRDYNGTFICYHFKEYNQYNEWLINNNPIFPTREECERYWHFMDTVKEKSYTFSDDDWTYDDVEKYSIYYDYGEKCFYTRATYTERYLGEIYFKTEESAKYIIDNFKEELMKYWL